MRSQPGPKASPQAQSKLTASGFSESGRGATHLLLGSIISQIKPRFLATIIAPRATTEGGTDFPHPPASPKSESGRGELCCSTPSCSNVPVGQYTLCPRPADPPLVSALPLPPLFLVPSTQTLHQRTAHAPQGPPMFPHLEDLSTLCHRHGISPDLGRGGSAFSPQMGCPLHSQGKKTCMEERVRGCS